MLRRASVVTLALTLGLTPGVVPVAVAQDAPPAITYVGPDGATHGTITIREVTDPFPSTQPAQDGSRFVGLTVAFESADDQTFEANPSQVALIDTDGTLYYANYIPRDVDPMLPDLQAQTMAPGNRISGLIGYTVAADAVLDQVVYVPSSDQLITITDLVPDAGSGAAPGTAVPLTVPDGSAAELTVTMSDPFTGFDPSGAPQDGMRFAVLSAAFENTGDVPFRADPYQVILRDAAGHLYWSTYVTQPEGFSTPQMESQTMAPGDHISGLIPFQVPVDAQIVEVRWVPASNRDVAIADLAGGTVPTPVEPSAAPAEPSVAPASEAPVSPDPSAGSAQ